MLEGLICRDKILWKKNSTYQYKEIRKHVSALALSEKYDLREIKISIMCFMQIQDPDLCFACSP